MASLQDQLVVVTGASRGIGAATAKEMAKNGARVLLLARTAVDLEKVVGEIEKEGGKGVAYPVDLTDHVQVTEVAKKIMEEQGVPDVLVNNAGAGRWLFPHETEPQEAEFMIKLPYLAAFWLTSAFLPEMLKRKSGRILNVNSPVCFFAWGGATAYSSSRWALRGFTESMTTDLLGTGVSVCHCILGEVSSNYFVDNPGSHERLPSIAKYLPVSTPEQAGRWLVKAAKSKRKRLTRPYIYAIFRFFDQVTPWAIRWTVNASSYKIKNHS